MKQDGGPDSAMIDWSLAESTALRLLPRSPKTDLDEAREVVEGLRTSAREAVEPISDVTQLEPAAPMAPVAVVDRPTWVRYNVESVRSALDPLLAGLRERRRRKEGGPAVDDVVEAAHDDPDRARSTAGPGVVDAIGSRATGFQVGTLLAYLGTKVLGQHEVFTPEGRAPALLLVAPNILVAERTLGVDPTAFRLWVCLHEETHRLQLSVAPWLPAHIAADLERFFAATDTDPAARDRVGAVVAAATRAVRGEHGPSLLEAVQTPEQRDILDRLVALMSLLEGHADWAMDAVGDDVVPGVADVRQRFEQRRKGSGALDQALRRLFGLDAKLAQYREGAAFVRGVVELVGVEGLNAAWTSAETLPMREEIAEPRRWVERVHAGSAS